MSDGPTPTRRAFPVTLREVAQLAGVSRSAVSRAFTPGANVSAKKRAAIAEAAQTLGYSPSVLASALTTGRTKMIGLVSNNFQNPSFLEVFDQFTRGLQERQYRPLLVNLSGVMGLEEAVQLLRRYSVDGVILASSTLPPALSQLFVQAGLPLVHSFGRLSDPTQVHRVGIDNRAAGRLAAQTLLARGYRRIGFLGGPETATSTQDRLLGFQELAARGLTLTHSFATAYSYDAGRSEMQRLLRQGAPMEAYFCGDDILSIGALNALSEAGVSVPGDVGILGLNDMHMAAWPTFNLTTIRQPIAEIITASIELVLEAVNDPELAPQSRQFPCSVIERGTLRPVA